MDGRDIGTTVFPDAELKIFVTATPEIRAQRRYDELKAKGEEASFDEILENVKQRDYIYVTDFAGKVFGHSAFSARGKAVDCYCYLFHDFYAIVIQV